MTRSKPKLHKINRDEEEPDYPLQGSPLDLPLEIVLQMDNAQRGAYIRKVLNALHREIQQGTMALKTKVSMKKELRDLRHLLRAPADKFLYTTRKPSSVMSWEKVRQGSATRCIEIGRAHV